MKNKDSFSQRHGFADIEVAPITIRNDAPYELRGLVIQVGYDLDLSPTAMREIICSELMVRPDKNNWSEFPNIHTEITDLVDTCPWFKVYDIIERLSKHFVNHGRQHSQQDFDDKMNMVFLAHGIGWKLVNGVLSYRGPEGFDAVVANAVKNMNSGGYKTASSELHEAIKDMSRRPDPEVTGAVQHAMASLECVARDITKSNETLGEWIKRNPNVFPKPLDQVIEKIWGFTSENGRHLAEGREPKIEEAELIVGLSAALGCYLSKKGKSNGTSSNFFDGLPF